MILSSTIRLRVSCKWSAILLFTCVLSLLSATPARAQSSLACVADFNGVLDGNVNPVTPPSHLDIDGSCTIKNYPASNPFTSNVSFYGNNPTSWLVIFDNVDFTGNMSCDKSQGNYIWFTNGSVSGLKPNCQNLFVPTEKINKQNPAGQTTATIGVPFTYKMTMPVLFDPVTGTVINPNGSPNDLHDITITDDLNATGADLTFVSQRAYWLNGTPIPHTFSNAGGVLTFGGFPTVPAGQQFVIELTVMLSDTPANVPGKQFVNTAKWQFGRLIGSVFVEPLPGQWGVTPPMTIAGPSLVFTKSGPATMNSAQWGTFGLDVQNTGVSDAWNVSLRDLLPQGAAGGMCNLRPEILSAQVFAADGVTAVAGKGPLNRGTDYSFSYSAAPTCQLNLTMLTAAGTIGPSQHLIISYRTQLDANSQNGATLTNIAGAIQWFNGDSSIPTRKTYTGPLTNGTPGVPDNQDAHTVTVALSGQQISITKQVSVVGGGAALPGAQLDYVVTVVNSGAVPASNVVITDALNAGQLSYVPLSATMNGSASGVSFAAPTLTVNYAAVNGTLAPGAVVTVKFRATLNPSLVAGTVVTNTGVVNWDNPPQTQTAQASVSITVGSVPGAGQQVSITKQVSVVGGGAALPGAQLDYVVTVVNSGAVPASNVVITDALNAGQLSYVPLSATMNGSASGVSFAAPTLTVNYAAVNGTLAPGAVVTVKFRATLNNSLVAGTVVTNTGVVNWDNPPQTQTAQASVSITVGSVPGAGQQVSITKQVSVVGGGAALPGAQLDYVVTVVNSGAVPASNVVITDALNAGQLSYVPLSATMNGSASGVSFAAPTLTVNYAAVNGTLAPGAVVTVKFRATLNPSLVAGTVVTNTGVVNWDNPPQTQTAQASVSITVGSVPGAGQQVSITKQVSVVGGGAALPGAQLDYVVTVVNSGAVPASNVVITDALNAGQLSYVPLSATMNGSASGVSFAAPTLTVNYAAVNGTLAPGAVVTVKFRATLNNSLVAGTVVTNTGVVNWDNPPQTQTAQASVSITVGSVPGAGQQVSITKQVSVVGGGAALPGAQLDYVVTVVNSGAVPASNVVITDALNAGQLSYVPLSATMNGSASGVSFAAPTLTVNYAAVNGTLAPGAVVTVKFRATLNPSLVAGTVVTNTGVVNWDNPPQTQTAQASVSITVGSVPGAGQQVSITKQVSVVGGGAALPGAQLDYVVTVVNSGAVPASNVVITDALNAGQLSYVPLSATMNGSASGVSFAAPTLTVNYAAVNGTLAPGAVVTVKFRATLNPSLVAGTVVTNTGVVNWDNPPQTQTAQASVSITVGSVPGAGQQVSITNQVSVVGGGAALPGAQLDYVVTVVNSGAVPASNVVITDALNAGQLSYVPLSATMNGSSSGVSFAAPTLTVNYAAVNGTLAPGAVVTVKFRATLNPSLVAGTVVTNTGVVNWDNPPQTQTAQASVSITVGSVPGAGQQVSITKQVSVVGGGAALPGAQLDYVVTVVNSGAVPASNVVITDALNAGQLSYVPLSATMNGSASGVSFAAPTLTVNYAAVNGTLAPGAVVTVKFRATLNNSLVAGTVVTNTGVVNWDNPPQTQTAQASVSITVGSVPGAGQLVSITNQVSVVGGGPAVPGAQLDYVLNIVNTAAVPASNVVITDDLNASQPGQLAYVNLSATANGSASGVSFAGSTITVNYGAVNGTLAPGAVVTVKFQVTLNSSLVVGTVATNTGVVAWDTPTQTAQASVSIIVGSVLGAGQLVSITNQVSVVGGGPAVPGAQLDYVLNIVNTAAVPASNVVITDDLNASQPGQLAYVNLSATMNGSASGVSFAGSTITVNYGAVNGTLAPGAVVTVKFRATLNSSLAAGAVVTNTGVAAWDTPTQTVSASVSIVVGSMPGLALLNGSAWYDANFDSVQDSSERALAGWSVELYRDNQLSQSVQTDANGVYRIIGVEPNDTTGVHYELRFRAQGAGANTAMLGRAVSPFTNGLQRISDIVVSSGANLQGLNLPIHPNGVIYNSLARTPIAGTQLTMLDGRGASPLPAVCFDDAAQQGQITLADGYYRFDINFSDPACPSGSDYVIAVAAPAGANYVAGYSQIIPPTSTASTAAFSVPACPGSAADAIPGTAMFCEVQPSAFAPAASATPRSAGTTYYVHLRLDGSQIPGSSQIFNNHIPMDPQILGSITITKTTPLLNVSRGQLVPYTITANNHSGQLLTDVSIVDRFPAGFTYVKGSALLDGVPTEPSVVGLTLSWNGLTLAGTQVRTLKVLFAVGAGVNEGEYVNRAQSLNAVSGAALSGEATATVRLAPDPTFDCTDVMGKIFNDANRNGRQDDGEEGLPGVRVVTPTGLQATTDKYGRYHITCATVPNGSRGSNFVLKLDDRTLPSGFRMSTDQVQIQRATSGKTLQINFGASIHRVVAIDLLDAAFEPDKTEIRAQWKPRLNLLLDELRKEPAVLRLSYVADTEDAALVEHRVEAVKRQLTEAWGANSSYVLTIEPEVFWRRGGPPKQPKVRVPESR